jgi:hypothetical protein
MNFSDVYFRKTDDGIDIVGKVKFTQGLMGAPPGQVVVTIIDSDQKVLYKASTHYYRYGKPTKESDTANFSLTIPLMPPRGSNMRLTQSASL